MKFGSNALVLITAGTLGFLGGVISNLLRDPVEERVVVQRVENSYDDSGLREELRILREEMSARNSITSEPSGNGGRSRDYFPEKRGDSVEEIRESVKYVTIEDSIAEARRQAQIYGKSALLSHKRGIGLETAALLYSSLGDKEVEALSGAVDTVSHFGDRMGLSPEAQADIISQLHNQRVNYFASQNLTSDGLRNLARTDSARFEQVIGGYRRAEAGQIANWFLNGNTYVTHEQANRAVGYFNGPGAQHVEQGISSEVQRLIGEANGRSWSFGW